MDLTYLHTVCKTVRREVAEDFKNEMDHPIFELTDNVIQVGIDGMAQTMGQKVRSKMYNLYNITPEQENYIKTVIDQYLKKAIERGLAYANSKKKTG